MEPEFRHLAADKLVSHSQDHSRPMFSASIQFYGKPMTHQPHATLLITLHTQNHAPVFAEAACAREAVESLFRIRVWNPFVLHGFVIMPSHCTFLVGLPANISLPTLVERYKEAVTFNLDRQTLWSNDVAIAVPEDVNRALKAIHQEPVRAGFCLVTEHYAWSSAHERWSAHS